MEYKTMPAKQNVHGAENDNSFQNQSDHQQSQKIGDMEQQIDYNMSKQDFGSNTLRPLNDGNNNRNEEMPEFGADEKVLNQNDDDDENEGPKNPEIPNEGDPTPVEKPISI